SRSSTPTRRSPSSSAWWASRCGTDVRAGEGSEVGEGLEEDGLLLEVVDRRGPRRRASRLAAAHSSDAVGVLVCLVEASLHEVPRAHVLGLLLEPDDLTGVRVAGERLRHLLARPRVELLDPHDGGRGAELVAPGDGVVADLAAREDDPTDRRGIDPVVVDDLAEVSARELVDG